MKTKRMKRTSYAFTPLFCTNNGVVGFIRPVYNSHIVGRNKRYVRIDCPWHQTIESYEARERDYLVSLDETPYLHKVYHLIKEIPLFDYVRYITPEQALRWSKVFKNYKPMCK